MPYNNVLYATEQEARNYYLPLSSQALFMDPSAPTFYVKTVDAFGQPDFLIADFTIRESQSETPLTRADLDSFRSEILSMIQPQSPSQPQPHQGGTTYESNSNSLDSASNN